MLIRGFKYIAKCFTLPSEYIQTNKFDNIWESGLPLFILCSDHSHVSHLSPSLIVSIWSIWILYVVRTLNGELGIIRVMHEELDFSL